MLREETNMRPGETIEAPHLGWRVSCRENADSSAEAGMERLARLLGYDRLS
jgi:hypothetical protein